MDLDLYSVKAESATLGAIILDNSTIDEILGIVKVEDFYLQFHQHVFEAIIELHEKRSPIDTYLVDVHLPKGYYDHGELYVMVHELTQATYAPQNGKLYAATVKELSDKRKVASLGKKVQRLLVENTASEALCEIAQEMEEISAGAKPEEMAGMETFHKMIGSIDDNEMNEDGYAGISTGIAKLDEVINGLQKGHLITLGARTGMGKTTLAINIFGHLAFNLKKPVVFFSLEQTYKEIMLRMMSCFGMVLHNNLVRNTRSPDDYTKLVALLERTRETKFNICDRANMTIADMRAELVAFKAKHGLEAVFVDHLSCISGDGENENLRLGKLSWALKGIAKDFDVPVVMLSQLNRDTDKRENKEPTLVDLRQSGSIEQDSDIVMLLYREAYYTKTLLGKNTAKLIVAKNRHGECKDITLGCDMEYLKFYG